MLVVGHHARLAVVDLAFISLDRAHDRNDTTHSNYFHTFTVVLQAICRCDVLSINAWKTVLPRRAVQATIHRLLTGENVRIAYCAVHHREGGIPPETYHAKITVSPCHALQGLLWFYQSPGSFYTEYRAQLSRVSCILLLSWVTFLPEHLLLLLRYLVVTSFVFVPVCVLCSRVTRAR